MIVERVHVEVQKSDARALGIVTNMFFGDVTQYMYIIFSFKWLNGTIY